MSSVVVGFIPTPPGQVALEQAIKEARMRSARLVVVNSKMGEGRESEAEFFDAAEAWMNWRAAYRRRASILTCTDTFEEEALRRI